MPTPVGKAREYKKFDEHFFINNPDRSDLDKLFCEC